MLILQMKLRDQVIQSSKQQIKSPVHLSSVFDFYDTIDRVDTIAKGEKANNKTDVWDTSDFSSSQWGSPVVFDPNFFSGTGTAENILISILVVKL